MVRLLLRAASAMVSLVLVYATGSIAQTWLVGRGDDARTVDAIVVMGAAQYDGRPSKQLQSRLDHVVTLWNAGWAPLVVTTGGSQPGDRFTEAQTSATYLVAAGIPEDAIDQRALGSTTRESLVAVREVLRERGASRVLIVTDPFHALRSRTIARQLGLQAWTSSTPSSLVHGWQNVRLHLREGVGVALGRIIGFERLERLSG
ncbi:MAG: YdcF family protein [Mycobacterium sp.]|nr:YdcF family protein [Mycobacterium sp.]